MTMALHGMAHYSLLQVGLGEMFDAKVVKLVLLDYSGVLYFGDTAYACMGKRLSYKLRRASCWETQGGPRGTCCRILAHQHSWF